MEYVYNIWYKQSREIREREKEEEEGNLDHARRRIL
jgi:hypothetical protein